MAPRSPGRSAARRPRRSPGGGCAGAARRRDEPDLSFFDLQARLAARASSLVGHAGRLPARRRAVRRGLHRASSRRCTQAEGVPLRPLMRRRRRASGPASTARVARRSPVRDDLRRRRRVAGARRPRLLARHLRPEPERPRRRRPHARRDVVEYVVDGTVVFIHRGGKAVARGAMDAATGPDERSAGGARRELADPRARTRASRASRSLAGALFAGYGRIDPASACRASSGRTRSPAAADPVAARRAAAAGVRRRGASRRPGPRTAAAPKSSCESRRTSGITAPRGSSGGRRAAPGGRRGASRPGTSPSGASRTLEDQR